MASRYSVLDLTFEQIERIEKESGIPYAQWGDEDQPLGRLNPLLYAAFTGEPVEEMRKLTPRQWQERNQVTDGEPDPEG